MTTKPQLRTRLKYSFGTMYRFFTDQWHYALLALGIGLLVYIVLFWVNNLPTISYIISSTNIPFGVKLQLLSGTFTAIIKHGGSLSLATTLLIALLQGFALAALVYIIRRQRSSNRSTGSAIGGAGIAGALAALGVGCGACGTSLVTPILVAIGASSSTALASTIGNIALAFSLVISVYSIYVIGKKLSMVYID